MKQVTTASGFTCEIDETRMDDMEMLDDLVALDGGDLTRYPAIIGRLFSTEEKARLYDHLRTEDGRVPVTAFGTLLMEIIQALGDQGKK